MKVIRIFNAQPVKIPAHFNTPLTRKQHGEHIFLFHFFNVHIMNVNYAKFQKSLIVEQFQGNYRYLNLLFLLV